VGRVVVEFLREVDDLDRIEGTLFDADATGLAETQLLGDRDLIGAAGVVLALVVAFFAGDDTLLAGPVWRAEVRTLVVTPVGLAAI